MQQPNPGGSKQIADAEQSATTGVDHLKSDRLQVYRQPLVTASGIILGFVLNFASAFVKSDGGVSETLAYLVMICLVVGVVCLVLVLARMLRHDVAPEQASQHYGATRRLFIFGVSAALFGALVDMASNFWS